MTAAQRAMTRWLGTLARGGVVDADAQAGEAIAAYVVGEGPLDALRDWFASAEPEVAVRERRACVEVCVAMAHADRVIQPEERHLLAELVRHSGLDAANQAQLVERFADEPRLEVIEARLTQPVLRELMLTLAWELALSDGEVDPRERTFFGVLAERFGVDDARAEEIRAAVSERIG